MVSVLSNVIFSDNDADLFVWKYSPNGIFSCKFAAEFFKVPSLKVAWGRELWHHYLPPSQTLLCWKAFHQRLPTDDHLQRKGMFLVSRCRLCASSFETIDHVLVSYPYALFLWQAL